jgi:uncharacterized protein (TIGR02453 family)
LPATRFLINHVAGFLSLLINYSIMLKTSSLSFLRNLKKNNNKPWFEANRTAYENCKTDFHNYVTQMIESITGFDKPIGLLSAKDCTFRINRDVRFSKDKSPYKANMGASFNRGGKKIQGAGYYFHFEPRNKSFAAGGIYMPMPPDLAKIRQEIDYSFNNFKKIVSAPVFKKTFTKGVEGIEVLSRPPKGYDETNPAVAFLKMKSFLVTRPITDAELQSKNLLKEVTKTFQTMKDFISFLNQAIQ